jgi:glycosyltransferase involved in cell wall biosynthesis
MRNTYFLNDCITTLSHKKKVLFITTKNVDYIRNSQEISSLQESAQLVKVIGYKEKSYVVRLIKIYIRLLTMSMKDYNLIFVGFAPQLILPLFGFKFKGKFIVEDFFISLYDTMIYDRKKFKPNSIFAKIFLWVDKIAIKSADEIIVDTCAHGDYFVSRLGADKSKINVLYLKADRTIYCPRIISKQEEHKKKFVVLYFGSILPLQGVDVILECVKSMENISSVVFEIIGPLNNKDLEKYKHLENVRFIPWLSQKSLAEKIASADLCLAGHFNNSIEKASRTIPGKAYIYASMKKPMILGDNPANRELFDEDNMKYYYVEMGNSNKLKEKILYVMERMYSN